ncbi:MAG: YgiQ family radical SAM protein [Pontiellaceae bacterium]|nr:YgiQ family radical SAM protein [Pontiellaceae bacterium]MBN2783437.1 YgiQ family radical SAM protein [Pontiellaceae bacterium]
MEWKERLAGCVKGRYLPRTMNSESSMNFLPTTASEMHARGWSELDVLLISGDAYVDHPSFAAAVIGRVLEGEGLRVGIVAQPDWTDPASLLVMGVPRLFCGITAGNLDSMLAAYTAARRKRRDDAYSEGGEVGKRPNMAVVVYSQLARRAFSGVPIVIGGIEASLRRTVHYDYWQDKLRPSILLDSKADILVYGMGERAIREIARRTAGEKPLDGIPGTARLLGGRETTERDFKECIALPSLEECQADKGALIKLAKLTEREQNPFSGKPLVQMHGARALLIEPPAEPLNTAEFDRIYELPFMHAAHPSYKQPIPAFSMIRDSITVVRGCGGGCTFCGLGMHQGRFLSSRSEESVVHEVESLAGQKSFHGTVTDLGGPTANLYGCRNGVKEACRKCRRASCLYPKICPNLDVDQKAAIRLMRRVRKLRRVKHVFIQSGIRMELALQNPKYIRELAAHHVSGHLKVAPEHLHSKVVRRMRKPGLEVFDAFRSQFEQFSREAGKKQYIVPYFISNFPGSTKDEMKVVEGYLRDERWKLQQVQDFIPLPMTPAAAMYYSGLDYETEQPIPVIRGLAERRGQMHRLKGRRPPHRKKPGRSK